MLTASTSSLVRLSAEGLPLPVTTPTRTLLRPFRPRKLFWAAVRLLVSALSVKLDFSLTGAVLALGITLFSQTWDFGWCSLKLGVQTTAKLTFK